MSQLAFPAALVLILSLLSGCASSVRPLMPTPTLYHTTPTKVLFEDLPPDRRRPRIEFLYVTDREPEENSETGLPYGEERARSLAFGTAVVDMAPTLDWRELERQSQLAERSTEVNLEMGRIEELGRFPLEPYAMERTPSGIRGGPSHQDHSPHCTDPGGDRGAVARP